MNLDQFVISENSSLREALQRIEANHHGVIFLSQPDGTITGLATDGDIRRQLLDGTTLAAPVLSCANTQFIWEKPDTPREILLKRLDHRIRVIPLLDANRRLVGVVSRDHLPLSAEGAVYARARSPVRISFGGGGSDLTHYFANHGGGAVINATISLYSHATLRLRDDSRVIIHSRDLGASLQGDDLASVIAQSGPFGLIQALLRAINPDFGFELFLHSDFPMNSGLGGSAVVAATVLGCFNMFRRDRWDQHEIAEIAYQAERHYLGVAGGWQDQYATVFGGFNFMEFRLEQNIVHPLRIHPETLLELEENLVLCDTGLAHHSGDIHEDQRKQMAAQAVKDLVETNVQHSYAIRNALLRGHLSEFGQLLDQAWELKRQLSAKISSSQLDDVYAQAKLHGAAGGKLLGAGGGGFFLFYVPPFHKAALLTHLENSGLSVRPFRFEAQGLQAWTARTRQRGIEKLTE